MIDRKQLGTVIKNCIAIYRKVLPDEYKIAINSVKQAKADQMNAGKFVDKGLDVMERVLCSIPEKLLIMFVNNLSDEENSWIMTKEGSIWFAKNFPDWALVEKSKI